MANKLAKKHKAIYKMVGIIPTAIILASSCGCYSNNALSNQTHQNDFTCSVNLAETIGHSFDFHCETPIENEDYHCYFTSTSYQFSSSLPPMPIHCELQLNKNIEVLLDVPSSSINAQNITNDCTLEHNYLTIPSKYIVGNNQITINLLGGEIAPWITWDNIGLLSDKALATKDQSLMGKYLQVGDYKRTYKGSQYVGDAMVLDFNVDDCFYGDEGNLEKAPVTFQLQSCYEKVAWGEGTWSSETYSLEKWEESGCQICAHGNEMSSTSELGFSPRLVNVDADKPLFSTFFILSYKDYTGSDYAGTHDGEYEKNVNTSNLTNSRYAYFNPNKYHSTLTFAQKIAKTNPDGWWYLRDVDCEYTGAYPRIWETHSDGNFFMNSNGTRYKFNALTGENPCSVFWTFCI